MKGGREGGREGKRGVKGEEDGKRYYKKGAPIPLWENPLLDQESWLVDILLIVTKLGLHLARVRRGSMRQQRENTHAGRDYSRVCSYINIPTNTQTYRYAFKLYRLIATFSFTCFKVNFETGMLSFLDVYCSKMYIYMHSLQPEWSSISEQVKVGSDMYDHIAY